MSALVPRGSASQIRAKVDEIVGRPKSIPTPKPRVCVDCHPLGLASGEKPKRDAPFPGPRCYTHNREVKKARKAARQDKYQQQTYGITQAEKEQVIEEQGGGCICSPWTGYNGKTRALSTDHDHETMIVRGVLCKHCNDLLGRVRDSQAYFQAMLAYLQNPPAVRVLGERIVPE